MFVFVFFNWVLFCFLSFQTVDIKVKMDCDGCERRVKNAVTSMKGSNINLCFSLSFSLTFGLSWLSGLPGILFPEKMFP